MKYVCKWWRIYVTTRDHFLFGGKQLIELGVDYNKMTNFVILDLFAGTRAHH